MTTIKAFDDLMNQFIAELVSAFPDEPKKTGVSCQEYIKYLGPWSTQLSAKDSSFFCEENEFAKNFGLHIIWKREDCSENTRNAIWQYLSSLYMIGTTMSMFPPETLSMIESVAENCAKNMKVDQSGQIDEKALMAGVNSMLSQMMSGGANPFAAMLSAGSQHLPPPKPQTHPVTRKPKSKKK
jgi:hypothetical protein